ncbi:hypothetical protein SSS_02888 [Sarcoptes scabiei]|uniref:Uncharacterized protein n=1 Tax=Sarcoptes scabiei TaxID=52283 RepID=A0A834RBQ9_SARSC|nr:hypothetical protein SSS_02888 [Sarcoptes scabiei]
MKSNQNWIVRSNQSRNSLNKAPQQSSQPSAPPAPPPSQQSLSSSSSSSSVSFTSLKSASISQPLSSVSLSSAPIKLINIRRESDSDSDVLKLNVNNLNFIEITEQIVGINVPRKNDFKRNLQRKQISKNPNLPNHFKVYPVKEEANEEIIDDCDDVVTNGSESNRISNESMTGFVYYNSVLDYSNENDDSVSLKRFDSGKPSTSISKCSHPSTSSSDHKRFTSIITKQPKNLVRILDETRSDSIVTIRNDPTTLSVIYRNASNEINTWHRNSMQIEELTISDSIHLDRKRFDSIRNDLHRNLLERSEQLRVQINNNAWNDGNVERNLNNDIYKKDRFKVFGFCLTSMTSIAAMILFCT